MSAQQTVENVYLRQEAAQLTRKHFWRLLGMLLIITALPALLRQLLTELGDRLMVPETTALLTTAEQYMNAATITSSAPVTDALVNLFTSPKFLLWNLFYGVTTGVLSAGLLMGQTTGCIIAGRGGVPLVSCVFGRMRSCLKAWGLELWSLVKITLWLLPGMGVMLLSGALMDLEGFGDLMILTGIFLMLYLGIQAFYRYCMAAYIMADEPERGIRECITLSQKLMDGRKWQYFRLGIPALLQTIGVGFLVMMAGELVLLAVDLVDDPLAAQILSIICEAATVYFVLQLNMVNTLFYLRRRAIVPDGPVSYWLREHMSTDIDDASPDTPADAMEGQPEDIAPETNDEKESNHEQPNC